MKKKVLLTILTLIGATMISCGGGGASSADGGGAAGKAHISVWNISATNFTEIKFGSLTLTTNPLDETDIMDMTPGTFPVIHTYAPVTGDPVTETTSKSYTVEADKTYLLCFGSTTAGGTPKWLFQEIK